MLLEKLRTMKIAAEIDVGKYFSETLCQSPLPLSSPIKKLCFYIKTRTKKLLVFLSFRLPSLPFILSHHISWRKYAWKVTLPNLSVTMQKHFASYKTNPYLKMSLKSKLCKSGSREKFLKSFHIWNKSLFVGSRKKLARISHSH